MESLFRDVRYGLRSLLRDKGFTLTVLLTLAVCIAANTATFAVVHSVLLKPLPVPDARSIVIMSNLYPKAGSAAGGYHSGVADYYDRLRDVTVLQEQALYRETGPTLDIDGAPSRLDGLIVTPSFFNLLQVQPAVGRAFTKEESEQGADQKVILSDGLSRQLFGSPAAAVGRDLRMGGRPYQVVGVMPPSFSFMDPNVRVWTPLAFRPQEKEQRHANNYRNIGRLKPGATIQQAQAQVDALNAANMERFPQFKEILVNAGFHTEVAPLEDMLVKDVRGALYLLWGGAAFVLLIGALNVANLVLARTALRRKELATRLALGAGPARLTRQFIVESVMLTLGGGAAGIALGAGILQALAKSGLKQLPRSGEIHIDATVIAVVLVMSAAIGVGIGLIPSLQALRAKLNEMMREDSRTGTGRKSRRVRQTLVIAEVGLAFVLLAGAGVLLLSFQKLLRVDPGFNAQGVLTLSSTIPRSLGWKEPQLRDLADRSLRAIRAIPGVDVAGLTTIMPLSGDSSDSVILAEGYQMRPGESLISPQQGVVSPGYFEAMNIGLVRGRYFSDHDTDGALNVIVVDERLAEHFWPNQNPLGKRVHFPDDINDLMKVTEKTRWFTVVGVVREIRLLSMEGNGSQPGACYYPYAQNPEYGFSFAIKTSGDPTRLTPAVRAEFAKVAPNLALFDVRTMSEREDLSLAPRRTAMTLALGFGLLALFLAAIGIYGVLAYLVTQRRREIGIRAALGCTAAGIMRMVLSEGLVLLGAGLLLGLAGAAALRRALQNELFGVGAFDPAVMSSVALTLAVVALLACALPARRASSVDPVIVLRED